MSILHIFGLVFFVFGVLLLLGYPSFTGFVVSENVLPVDLPIIGIICMFGGAIMYATGSLEKKLEVYDTGRKPKNENEREESYGITDPQQYFSSNLGGKITLAMFRKEIEKIREDSELIALVKESYGPKLIEIEKNYPEKKNIAHAFLKVLYDEKELKEREHPDDKFLSQDEERKIREAFRKGWKNEPNAEQREILREYGLDYEKGKKHGTIYSIDYPGINRSTSITPSDSNAGRSIGRDVVSMVKEISARKKSSQK